MKRVVIILALVLCITPGSLIFAETAKTPSSSEKTEAESQPAPSVWKYFAAAIAVGISCVAGGIAVGQIGAAAMGAMSENPELSGKALPYAGLAEGICLWGFLVALLILVIN
jgi:V/A-type H+-transporting ATPase subunit K